MKTNRVGSRACRSFSFFYVKKKLVKYLCRSNHQRIHDNKNNSSTFTPSSPETKMPSRVPSVAAGKQKAQLPPPTAGGPPGDIKMDAAGTGKRSRPQKQKPANFLSPFDKSSDYYDEDDEDEENQDNDEGFYDENNDEDSEEDSQEESEEDDEPAPKKKKKATSSRGPAADKKILEKYSEKYNSFIKKPQPALLLNEKRVTFDATSQAWKIRIKNPQRLINFCREAILCEGLLKPLTPHLMWAAWVKEKAKLQENGELSEDMEDIDFTNVLCIANMSGSGKL